jgi:hypothetical protein
LKDEAAVSSKRTPGVVFISRDDERELCMLRLRSSRPDDNARLRDAHGEQLQPGLLLQNTVLLPGDDTQLFRNGARRRDDGVKLDVYRT